MHPAYEDDALRKLASADRAALSQRLDAVVSELDVGIGGGYEARQLFITVTAFASLVLIPWIVALATLLPPTHSVTHWRETWVGFDIVLALALAATAWLAFSDGRPSCWQPSSPGRCWRAKRGLTCSPLPPAGIVCSAGAARSSSLPWLRSCSTRFACISISVPITPRRRPLGGSSICSGTTAANFRASPPASRDCPYPRSSGERYTRGFALAASNRDMPPV